MAANDPGLQYSKYSTLNETATGYKYRGWRQYLLQLVEATLLAKKVVTPSLKTIKPMWIELLCFHLAEIGMIWTRDCSPTKSDTTLGRHSMQGQVGAPKPQYRWSFPQINLHTVTTLNQYLHIFSKVFLIVRTMPRPTPMGIRHEVFALAREGIKQGAIATRVGLTRATVNRILKRHAATGSLVPGKSSGAPERQHPGKTVHCWGWSDRIVSWVLGPWRRGWEICTEWGLVAQRLNTDSCLVVTGHIDPQRSPC